MRLKELRTAKKMTQDKLSKMLGVSRTTVTMWEAGASEPDTNTLLHIADILNVSVDYLLGNSDIKNAPTPERVDADPERRELDKLIDRMSQKKQEELIRYAQYLLSLEQNQEDAKS